MECLHFENLTIAKFLILEVILLLPTIVNGVLFYHLEMPMIALEVYMLVCLLIMPILYIKFVVGITSSETVNIAASLANIYFDVKEQLFHGALAFVLSGGLMFGGLWFALKNYPIWNLDSLKTSGIAHVEIILFSVLMLTLQPILEELFWRGFIQTFFAGGITYLHPKEIICIWIAIHYAAMQIFIFAKFTIHFKYAVYCALPFIFVGRMFTFYRHRGILTGVLGHLGLNSGFVVILNLYYWQKWSTVNNKLYDEAITY